MSQDIIRQFRAGVEDGTITNAFTIELLEAAERLERKLAEARKECESEHRSSHERLLMLDSIVEALGEAGIYGIDEYGGDRDAVDGIEELAAQVAEARAHSERLIKLVEDFDYFNNKGASEVWTRPLVKAMRAARAEVQGDG